MLKNKIIIIALIAILVFSLTITIVRAENNTEIDNKMDVENGAVAVDPELTEESHDESSADVTEEMKKNDVYNIYQSMKGNDK